MMGGDCCKCYQAILAVREVTLARLRLDGEEGGSGEEGVWCGGAGHVVVWWWSLCGVVMWWWSLNGADHVVIRWSLGGGH